MTQAMNGAANTEEGHMLLEFTPNMRSEPSAASRASDGYGGGTTPSLIAPNDKGRARRTTDLRTRPGLC